MKRKAAIATLCIVGVLLAARAALAPAAWQGFEFKNGSTAIRIASVILAGRGAQPYRICAAPASVLVHGKSEVPGKQSVALEVVQVGSAWGIREAEAPDLWGDEGCKYANSNT